TGRVVDGRDDGAIRRVEMAGESFMELAGVIVREQSATRWSLALHVDGEPAVGHQDAARLDVGTRLKSAEETVQNGLPGPGNSSTRQVGEHVDDLKLAAGQCVGAAEIPQQRTRGEVVSVVPGQLRGADQRQA